LNDNVIEELTPTDTYISKAEFARPTFSKYFGSWEIDIADNVISPNKEESEEKSSNRHLFCINMNSRYLFVVPIAGNPNLNAESTGVIDALQNIWQRLCILYSRCPRTKETDLALRPIRYIKGDGDTLFTSTITENFLKGYGIKPCWQSSPFTFHNKLVDVAIKTIRNAIGYRIITEAQLQTIVDYYNNTYHKGIDCTPTEMLLNPDYEEQYIRYCMERLVQVKMRQEEAGLLSYVPGDVLLLHCDVAKTSNKNDKRRKFWDRIGIFQRYEHGNALVTLMGNQRPIKVGGSTLTEISVPVYYTRKIADDERFLPTMYTSTYAAKEDRMTEPPVRGRGRGRGRGRQKELI
jgi:hypothetical protein